VRGFSGRFYARHGDVNQTLTPALSHRMGEGELSQVLWEILRFHQRAYLSSCLTFSGSRVAGWQAVPVQM